MTLLDLDFPFWNPILEIFGEEGIVEILHEEQAYAYSATQGSRGLILGAFEHQLVRKPSQRLCAAGTAVEAAEVAHFGLLLLQDFTFTYPAIRCFLSKTGFPH